MPYLTEPQPQEEAKKPDFIITDDEQEYAYGSHGHAGSARQQEEELLKLKRKNPVALRLLCLLGLFFCLIFVVIVALWLAFMGALAALFLFRNENINRSIFRFLKLIQNSLVITFGLLVALFSPVLGFGLLILYFSLKGETKDCDLLRRMLKRFL